MAQKASVGQVSELVGMIAQGIYDDAFVQAMIEKRVIIKPEGSPYRGDLPADANTDRITVPDLTAGKLVALAKKELKLTYLDDTLTKWGFVTDERGKTYEVQVWKPGREVVPATEVREHFTDGFVGNTAAFIAWVTKHNPEGYHASIPADDRLFQRGSSLDAPDFIRGESYRGLGLDYDVRGRWHDYWAFVAFREFKSA